MSGLNPRRIAAFAVALGALAFPATAPAHVTLQPSDAQAGQFTRLDVRVPNEQDNASTEKVEVQFPNGFAFVSTQPIPGWTARVKTEKLTTPIDVEGEKVDEQTSQVTFTADNAGARIGPGEFQDFGLSVRIPDKSGTLTFKALQTYSNGEVVRWIGPPDSEEPAPQVTVTAAAQGSQTGAATEEESEDESDALSVIALIAAGLALLVAIASLVMRRRRA